jgi:hypothetical protein
MMANVTLERAREILGVDASADAGTVRRAYLRLLKKHNPERDPEGFKQLREAFERARDPYGFDASGPFPWAAARGEPADAIERPDVFEPPEVLGSISMEEAPPSDVREIQADQEAEDATSSVERPWTLPIPSEAKDAAPILTAWLVAATRDPDAPPPPSLLALDLLWALLHRRAFKSAKPLYVALDAYREHAGLRGLELQWTLTEALWSQRRALPVAVYAPMIESVAQGDPTPAAQALGRLSDEDPAQAYQLRCDLERDAAPLAQVFGPMLPDQRPIPAPARGLPDQPPASPSTKYNGFGVLFFVCISLSGVLRMCVDSSSSRRTVVPTVKLPTVQMPPQPVAAAWDLQDEASLRGHPELATIAASVGEALTRQDCEEARYELERAQSVVAALPALDRFHLEPKLDALAVRVRSRCPR